MGILIVVFLVYFGVFSIVWVFLVSLFYPKTDKRFKTGYKNNQVPDKKKIKSFNKWYWIIVSSIFVFIAVIIAIALASNPSSEETIKISVYQRPDNKSKVIDKIPEDTKYKILRDTKYFHYIHYQDSLKGYILK